LGKVPVEELIDEVAGSFSVKMREKNIDFYWRHPDSPLPEVCADRTRLHQILSNLLGNSIKFTENQGHIEIKAGKTNISGPNKHSGNFVQISIKDNGRGIPKREQAKIFSKFFRTENVVEDEVEGAGLGLYLTKRLVEMHGGEIWFESKDGDGTSFFLTVPVC
jgi:signal transduction histidine kinase